MEAAGRGWRLVMLSVYATVYNNVYVVEESVRSLLSAVPFVDEVVVVDNCSVDGTWEVLSRLREELPVPLRLYRRRCSRGLGRQLALERARGDYVMYVDLDCVFHPELGTVVRKLLEECEDGVYWDFYGVATRRTMELIGGWRDLNMGEDWELVARAIRRGVRVRRPLIPPLHDNIRRGGEVRYSASRVGQLRRRVRNIVDAARGIRPSPAEVLYMEGRLRPSVAAAMAVSALLYRGASAIEVVYSGTEYLLPEELGLPRRWMLGWWEHAEVYWRAVKPVVLGLALRSGDLKMARVRRGLLVYRDREALERFLRFVHHAWGTPGPASSAHSR